jgi:hypothetical protein
MPEALAFLCYLIAFLSFLAGAFGVAAARVNLIAVGLAAWVLVPLVNATVALG